MDRVNRRSKESKRCTFKDNVNILFIFISFSVRVVGREVNDVRKIENYFKLFSEHSELTLPKHQMTGLTTNTIRNLQYFF